MLVRAHRLEPTSTWLPTHAQEHDQAPPSGCAGHANTLHNRMIILTSVLDHRSPMHRYFSVDGVRYITILTSNLLPAHPDRQGAAAASARRQRGE